VLSVITPALHKDKAKWASSQSNADPALEFKLQLASGIVNAREQMIIPDTLNPKNDFEPLIGANRR
jgi:hypothetical protein